VRAAVMACILLAVPAGAADAPGAIAEARRCWGTIGEPGIAACRHALDLGLSPARSSRVELTLGARLGALGRWEEAAEVHHRAVARRPGDAEAHRRLGVVLLHGLGRPADAEASLRDALRLGNAEARTWGDLALALLALGRPPEAVTAFESAIQLDPTFLEGRPGSRAAYEAARAGRPWPPPPS
jgi:tetratricopeptide (TPR) repeat protein